MTVDASILVASRVLGVLLFGIAVLGKIRHRVELVGVVANYRLVPAPLAPLAAWLIVILELGVVISLGMGIWSAAGAVLAVSLLVTFAAAMAVNVARGRTHIDCGCFQTALRQPLSVWLIVRNMVLICLLWPLTSGEIHSATPVQLLDGIGAGVALFLLYQVFGHLLALREAADTLRKRFT